MSISVRPSPLGNHTQGRRPGPTFLSFPVSSTKTRERESTRAATGGPKERRHSRACLSTDDVHPRVSAPPSNGSVVVPLAGGPSRRAEELGVPVPNSDDIGSGERWAQGETFGCRVA
jgi:hypothetical protein